MGELLMNTMVMTCSIPAGIIFSTDNVWSNKTGRDAEYVQFLKKPNIGLIGSAFSRLSYIYNNKYILEANPEIRREFPFSI